MNLKLYAPSSIDCLTMMVDETVRATRLRARMGRSETFSIEGSSFIAYSLEVSEMTQINEGYVAIRAAHTGARHVVCAFRIPNQFRAQYNDFCDDEEWGCGRILLNALEYSDIEYRCIYVVRYYRGIHIGSKRFTYYLLAARAAIVNSIMNSIANKAQTPWNEEYANYYLPSAATNNVYSHRHHGGRGGRGGGRGRGRGNGAGRGYTGRKWADNTEPHVDEEFGTDDPYTEFDEDGFPIEETGEVENFA